MPMHPLPIVINNGIPVALCSDDPAVFGNMGLSFDFFQVCFWRQFLCEISAVRTCPNHVLQVLVASEVTGLIQLGEMARDSIQVSVSVALTFALTFYDHAVLDVGCRG